MCGKEWQFNSRNGPVKTKFIFLITFGYFYIQNTSLLQLGTFWNDDTNARNIIETHFPK